MDIKLRPVNPETDFPRLAEIINQFEPISVTAERLHEWEANRPEGQLRQRHAAVDQAGYVVGFGEAVHQPWEQAGRFWVEVAVDSALARQGIGTQLYADAWQFAQQQGVTKAKSAVRDNCAHCLRFAEQRGFVIDRHIFDSTLALDTFDEQPFAGTIEAVEARGIRFFSLADIDVTEAAQRKLYELNTKLLLDVPGWDEELAPFEQFVKWVFEAPHYRADGQIIAANGENWVGLAAVGYFKEGNLAVNMITGVDRAYRGRKIALALKLLANRVARCWGVSSIRTNNDSQNAPMLKINRKLGYQPEPGRYILEHKPSSNGEPVTS